MMKRMAMVVGLAGGLVGGCQQHAKEAAVTAPAPAAAPLSPAQQVAAYRRDVAHLKEQCGIYRQQTACDLLAQLNAKGLLP